MAQVTVDEPETEGIEMDPETLEEMPEPEPEIEYRALVVRRKSLPRLDKVFESFAETGASDWDAETIRKVAWERLPDPLFCLWALVRLPQRKLVGFLGVQMQPGPQGKEGFVLAVHVLPGESLEATDAFDVVLSRWAEAMGAVRLVMRTRRGDLDGPAEPRAWERLGFEYDSTILVREMADHGEASA